MKVLILADIHVDDYRRFNPTPGYRLDQFRKLAELITTMPGDEIWLAGDTINKPVPTPMITHSIKQFITTISKDRKVRFIRGQHDTFGKVSIDESNTSILNLFSEYMTYEDHKIEVIGGRRVAWMNWSRKQDLSWITEPVDVMIGHLTHGFGQDWDRSKFKIGFFGDIHRSYSDGNIVSIGNPIQHKLDDQEEGSAILLDLEDLSYTRIPIKGFLKFKYTEEGLGYNPDTLTYEVKRKTKHKIDTSSVEVKLDLDSTLNELLTKKNLHQVHEEVLATCKDYHPINLNFRVKWIEIHNTKGIHHLKHEFENNLTVVGANGTGKSSFIVSLFQLLTGSFKWKDVEMWHTTDPGWIKGEVEYQGISVKIKRAKKSKLWINDKEIPIKDQKSFNDEVKRYLPFLRFHQLFFFNSWNQSLLGSLRSEQRMDILSRTQGLDIFHEYYRSSSKMLDSAKSELRKMKSKLSELEDELKSIDSKLKKLPSEYPEYSDSIEDLKYRKIQLESSLIQSQDAQVELDRLTRIIGSHTLDSVESSMRSLDQLDSKYQLLSSEVNTMRSEGKRMKSQIEDLQTQLDYLLAHPHRCSKCGQEVSDSHYKSELKNLRSQLDELNVKYNSLIDQFKSKRSELESLKLELAPEGEYDRLKSIKDSIIKKSKLKLGLLEDADILLTYSPSKSDLEWSKDQLQLLRDSHSSHSLWTYLTESKSKISESINSIKDKITVLKNRIQELESYSELVAEDGPIYDSILTKVAASLSSDTIRFRIDDHDLKVKYLNEKGEWRYYPQCSQGQQSIIDAYFLSKVMKDCGLLVFDEYFSHVDDSNLELVTSYLESMRSLIVVSTHSDNFNLESSVLNFNNIQI